MRRIRVVIFDWDRTTIDHGSLAPVRAVSEVFARRGVGVTDVKVRRDMGIYKRDHIRNLLFDPAIAARWQDVCGLPAEADVDRLFTHFIPAQTYALERYSTLIPGLLEKARRGEMWAVGVTATGNAVGLSADEWAPLDPAEQERRAAAAANRLRKVRAHYMMPGVSELAPVIEELEARMEEGDTV